MIILACDNCQRQSPNADGQRVADNWVCIEMQYQRDREAKRHGTRIILCETCFPLLGTEVKVSP